MINYIPAVAYTLYDGYYIYSLSEKSDSPGQYEHVLQPFIPYTEMLTKEASDDWIVINYTLDNYITIYGEISGDKIERNGFLTSGPYETVEDGEELSENLAIKNAAGVIDTIALYRYVYTENNVKAYFDPTTNNFFVYGNGEQVQLNYEPVFKKYAYIDGDELKYYYQAINDYDGYQKGRIYDNKKEHEVSVISMDLEKDYSARNYVEETEYFTEWFNNTIANNNWTSKTLGTTWTPAKIEGNNYPDPKISDPGDARYYLLSNFTEHKNQVIQHSIEENLNKAMLSQALRGEVSYDFRLPEIKPEEWDQLLEKVSIIAFAQGMPIGNKYFNNYAIASSTCNKEFVDPNELYFSGDLSAGTMDTYYHRKNCNQMDDAGSYKGYRNTDYVIKNQDYRDGNITKTYYYYLHSTRNIGACLL